MMHKAYVYAVQEEGGTKVWNMTEIELTPEEYKKFFLDDPAATELHACNIEKSVDGFHYWRCSCGANGVGISQFDATRQHRTHKYEEMGDE